MRWFTAGMLLLFLAACGGTSSPATATAAPTPTVASTAIANTPTTVPTATVAASPTSTAVVFLDADAGPCALLKAAEIEAAGAPAPTKAVESGAVSCLWTLTRSVQVINVHLFLDTQVFSSNHPDQAVAGIGDEAYWDPGLDILSVRVGDQAFTLQVLTSADVNSPVELEIAKKLAPSIIRRI